jgi:hypothetical protein
VLAKLVKQSRDHSARGEALVQRNFERPSHEIVSRNWGHMGGSHVVHIRGIPQGCDWGVKISASVRVVSKIVVRARSAGRLGRDKSVVRSDRMNGDRGPGPLFVI